MLSTGKHPNRHLHAALLDLILAVGAMAAHRGAIALDNPAWELLPDWLWPTLAAVFLVGALWSYGKHARQRR
ncbi:hypothetical protein [Luteimonas sp. 8-5]|uniref:hypothetical protein n=1 Tax=Luteimonas sp. 8-5 TaxID=3039387 RepID=UPI002436301C|nr:hypothetical protein [Luteimonas sp. 8-5]